MIIDTSQGDVQIVGDIKEFKTSIDPRNLEFITTLLSSNLYSDPEQSFIREIVSNAWDSHVEAGTTDTPVIIRIKNDSISIRDYGTGLSPERFQEIYCNIGSSTKRLSNNYIGGFGIGRFSAVACSNTVYITSYYEGTAYYYVMVKSNNTVTINLLMEKPTTEKNGVEVEIKNIGRLEPYVKALSCITFFPNIYIDPQYVGNKYNDVKIKKFKNFAVSSDSLSQRFLLGNVLYPCDMNLLSSDSRNIINEISNTGIVIRFNIGELDITPNRESIIYNQKTINVINNRIKEAKDEMHGIIINYLGRSYNDLLEYSNVINSLLYYDFISNTTGFEYNRYKFRINDIKGLSGKVTYKGKDLSGQSSLLNTLLSTTVPNFRGVIDEFKIHTKPRSKYYISKLSYVSSNKILILNHDARLVSTAQKYLKENYNNYALMTEISVEDVKEWIKNHVSVVTYNNSLPVIDFISSEFYKYITSKAETLDLNTDKEYLEYKEEIKNSTSKEHKYIKDIILYVWSRSIYSGYIYKEKKEFGSIDKAIEFIKNVKKGVIINNINNEQEFFKKVTSIRDYIYIEARKDIVSYLKSLKLNCVIDTDWLMYKDPTLSQVKTLSAYNYSNYAYLSDVYEIMNTIPKEDADTFFGIIKDMGQYLSPEYLCIAERETVPLDSYIDSISRKISNYYEKYNEVKCMAEESGIINDTIINAVLMKTKAYRINQCAYNKIKNNPLLKILCRK